MLLQPDAVTTMAVTSTPTTTRIFRRPPGATRGRRIHDRAPAPGERWALTQ